MLKDQVFCSTNRACLVAPPKALTNLFLARTIARRPSSAEFWTHSGVTKSAGQSTCCVCVCVCVLAQQTRARQKTVCWFLLAIGARVLRQRATNTRARPHAAYDVPCARVRIGYGAPRPPEIADRAWGPPRARRRRGTPPCRSGRPPAPPGPSAAIQAPSAAPDWHRIHKPSPPRVPHR
jgi:hypothetical protein